MQQHLNALRLLRRSALAALLVALAAGPRALANPPPVDPLLETRIEALLTQLTLDEKLDLVSGTGFDSRPVARLGIPALRMTDGPVGVRGDPATAFPASVAMAATWNPVLVGEVAQAIAEEVKAQGRNVLLAPCVNIHRAPQGGRNFESFGEDPYLAARMAVAYVRGVQNQNVVATVKHFACNNQEHERMTVDAQVDERTLHEIYLPAFKAAVQEGGVWAVMSAYNKLNGAFASENHTLLTEILKDRWGFRGIVMSDWGAVHSTVPTFNAGLDLEMPTGEYLNRAALRAALDRGEIQVAALDDKVRRLLRVAYSLQLDQPVTGAAINTPEHRTLARRVAHEGIVLLKNDEDLLPLAAFDSRPAPKEKPKAGEERGERGERGERREGQRPMGAAAVALRRVPVQSIAVIGPNAAVARAGGGGSSRVNPPYAVSLLEGLKTRLGERVALGYAPGMVLEGDIVLAPPDVLLPPAGKGESNGLWAEYFANSELAGAPAAARIEERVALDLAQLPAGLDRERFSVRWSGALRVRTSGRFALTIASDDGSRLYLDDRLLIDNGGVHALAGKSAVVELKAGQSHALRIEYVQLAGEAAMLLGLSTVQKAPITRAAELASKAQVAIVCVGFSSALESEGADRPGLLLPTGQDELINAVVAANPRTIVVVNSGAAVQFGDWISRVPVVIQAWYPGQEGGHALAEILFGDVNPSGRLPTSFPQKWEDAAAFGNYPGTDGAVRYAEGVFVGYRHLEKSGKEPLFAFGHGLGYTSFAYRDLRVTPRKIAISQAVEVSFVLRNTGMREGTEVVQLYIGDPAASLPRPPKELKAFQRVTLKPNEEQTVRFVVDASALRFYDPARHDWVVEPGLFDLYVGASSRDIWLRGAFTLD